MRKIVKTVVPRGDALSKLYMYLGEYNGVPGVVFEQLLLSNNIPESDSFMLVKKYKNKYLHKRVFSLQLSTIGKVNDFIFSNIR